MMRNVFLSALFLLGLLTGCQSQNSFTVNGEKVKLDKGTYAKIITNYGDILVELHTEKTPMTTANFIALAEGKHPSMKEEYQGEPFYDSLTFHRVIPDFMIQGGDPAGDGSGGPGYEFDNEIDTALSHEKGVISMANAGPNTNGSQFFITVASQPRLDGSYSIFGEVRKGQSIADSISQLPTGKQNKPEEPVIIKTIDILRVGQEAKSMDAPQIFQEAQERIAQERKEKEAAMEAQVEKYKDGAQKTPEGLFYKVLEEGDGPQPESGQKVMMNYVGMLPDGTFFDSNIEEAARENDSYNPQRPYKPFGVTVGPQARVIEGWKVALSKMNVGDKWQLVIPPELGYGERGVPEVIPPNSWLIFEVEMLSIQ